MKERPILFSGPMIRALLENRKTQTRRVMKCQPSVPVHGAKLDDNPRAKGWWHWEQVEQPNCLSGIGYCPYGMVGDRLWVRETFVIECPEEYDYSPEDPGVMPTDGRPVKVKQGDDVIPTRTYIPHYRATEPEPCIVSYKDKSDGLVTKWKPSIFMPRWASRITLEIKSIRVERVQDISEADAEAEGVERLKEDPRFWHAYLFSEERSGFHCKPNARESYQTLWDSINAKRGYGWCFNPYVWVVEFERVVVAPSPEEGQAQG